MLVVIINICEEPSMTALQKYLIVQTNRHSHPAAPSPSPLMGSRGGGGGVGEGRGGGAECTHAWNRDAPGRMMTPVKMPFFRVFGILRLKTPFLKKTPEVERFFFTICDAHAFVHTVYCSNRSGHEKSTISAIFNIFK